jgi:hypothetical protein
MAQTSGKSTPVVRGDVARLTAGLASPEKTELDSYLALLETYSQQQQQLRQSLSPASCQPARGAPDGNAVERLDAMTNMAALAIRCGVTNVVGLSFGNSLNTHDDLGFMSGALPGLGSYGGHDTNVYMPFVKKTYPWTMGLLVKLLRDLGPLQRDTFMVYTAANGAATNIHHGKGCRPPWCSMAPAPSRPDHATCATRTSRRPTHPTGGKTPTDPSCTPP